MSHLIIEQGSEVGREVAVPPTGMKFGRSPANDLVLDDDAVMLFHGRFFFKSDGSLWVTDFGAGDKTTVGGIPVDEHALKVGDLVEVGGTAFRIISTQLDHAPGAAKPVDDDIDLGFKGTKGFGSQQSGGASEESRNMLLSRLMQVGVLVLVLVVLVFVVPSLIELTKDNTKTVQAKPSLCLAYERVQADRENIFRYHLELDDKGRFTISIDDLKNSRHIVKEVQVSETTLLELSNSIEDAGFFEVNSDYAGTADGQYDLYDISVQRNQRSHHIKVLNMRPTKEIQRTAEVLKNFALTELGIPVTLFKDNAELIRLARLSTSLGQERYEERDVRYSNLAASIKKFKEAMFYLETFEPKPALYTTAERGLAIAETERDKRYGDFMFRADSAMRLKDWKEARRHLRILIELVPDRTDERYETVNTKLLTVEQRLR